MCTNLWPSMLYWHKLFFRRRQESFVIASVLLGIKGTLFLTYDLLGRENGPVRRFTRGLTCGLIRALVFTP